MVTDIVKVHTYASVALPDAAVPIRDPFVYTMDGIPP